jgi:hypothetical protein
MGLVTPTQSNPGDTIEAADVNTPVNELAAVVNGGLDDQNLANSAVTAAKLGAGAVTPEKLSSGNGTDWVWQSVTPTFNNWTVGDGSFTCYYTLDGKTAHFIVNFIAGATSTFSGSTRFAISTISAKFRYTTSPVGSGYFYDSSTGDRYPVILERLVGGSAGYYVYVLVSGKYVSMSSTVPVTIATGDYFTINATLEIA